jgi:formylglycine-generating enzyme required for sulfatase activity
VRWVDTAYGSFRYADVTTCSREMESRQFTWRGPSGSHDLVFAWVPGTSTVPYGFGHGVHRRSMVLAGFFISTTPVTQALWLRTMGDCSS